ncbi:hypothetical protein V6N12_026253 [Hibiscus sabdariffa]|uniref:Uncharacterized protein n=1 Tax=Hibiscus sabdariffa TaxID=183260 RepID=A0ABR2DRK9_9ROSI
MQRSVDASAGVLSECWEMTIKSSLTYNKSIMHAKEERFKEEESCFGFGEGLHRMHMRRSTGARLDLGALLLLLTTCEM